MGSTLLILETVLLFLTFVAVFLSIAVGWTWRVVRKLVLIVAVLAGAYFFGKAALVAPEWRAPFAGAAVVFALASVGLRLTLYRSSRGEPDRPRAIAWRRKLLVVVLPVMAGFWIVTAFVIDRRLRSEPRDARDRPEHARRAALRAYLVEGGRGTSGHVHARA